MTNVVLKLAVAAWAVPVLFVLSAAVTQAENSHASRFKQYQGMPNVRDGDESAMGPPGDYLKIVMPSGMGEVDRSGRITADYVREYGCVADTVVVATPEDPRSAFTAEGTFLFTTFDLSVETVIRGEASSGLRAKLIWPGGTLSYKSRTLIATDLEYRLPSAGRKYLFFLKTLRPGEFETVPQTAGYDITDSDAQSLGRGPLRERIKSYLLPALAFGAIGGC